MTLRFFRSLVLAFAFVSVVYAQTYEEPEAGAWFASQELVSAPGAKNKESLERLVDWLYKDGAVFVGVVLTEEEVSGLKVYLPGNKQSREQIFRVANRELTKSGYRAEDDEGQDALVIWF